MPSDAEMKIVFENGVLKLLYPTEEALALLDGIFVSDVRDKMWRGRACDYAEAVIRLRRNNVAFSDQAKDFYPLRLDIKNDISLREHQQQALSAWIASDRRGVVELPTGSGKTILAMFAIANVQRPTLVLCPTIDLMTQWISVIRNFFGLEPGQLGGGGHDIREITVSTYDSAVINMEFIGGKFGFLIADECHHLPGETYRMAAMQSIAPFRLGLSATPDFDDERAGVLCDLMGKTVYRAGITELANKVLSPYVTRKIEVDLEEDERREYEENRKIYLNFVRRQNINFALRSGWSSFINACSRTPAGRNAFAAFLRQRNIARSGRGKLKVLWDIFTRHRGEQIIVFTADNAAAYEIGEKFRLPVLTCRTKPAERKDFLQKFRENIYPILVTSRVLNEGVDVPAVGVGIVFSGSSSVREHVQRLGRILRPSPGKKQAVLYELLSRNTGEDNVSERRRRHQAYRR